jgi:hypothetical protein
MQEKELGSELLNVWLNKPSIDCITGTTTLLVTRDVQNAASSLFD